MLLALLFQHNFYYANAHRVVEQAIVETNQKFTESNTITEVWVALSQLDQPSVVELCDLFDELLDSLYGVLIVDLIKMIHQHLSANIERVFVGLQLHVRDSVRSWELAEIKQILWLPEKHEYFIYIIYVGYPSKWNEWIELSSERLKWMQNKQGQMITVRPSIELRNLQIGDCLDSFNPRSGLWERAQLVEKFQKSSVHVKICIPSNDCPSQNTSRRCSVLRLAPANTFTILR